MSITDIGSNEHDKICFRNRFRKEGGIIMIPKKIHILTRDLEILDAETPLTRAWVSLDPHEDRTEYTDLSQVWHNAKEEPEKGKSIISIGSTGVSAYKWVDEWRCDWLDFAEWSELFRWAYVDDLLPKGGE